MAGSFGVAPLDQKGCHLRAFVKGDWAARMEGAACRWRERRRQLALQDDAIALSFRVRRWRRRKQRLRIGVLRILE